MPNKQKATDYHTSEQRIKDDVELNWGDDDDVKSLWDSAAALLKITDSADVLRVSFDPATGGIVLTNSLAINNAAGITSDEATVALFDLTPTQINFGGNAAVDIGKTGLFVTVKGKLNVDEAVTFDSTLGVTGAVTLDDTLSVAGDATITGDFYLDPGGFNPKLYFKHTGVIGAGVSTGTINFGGIDPDVTNLDSILIRGRGVGAWIPGETASKLEIHTIIAGSINLGLAATFEDNKTLTIEGDGVFKGGDLTVGSSAAGNIGTSSNPNQLQFVDASRTTIEGSLHLTETTTPTAIANAGALFTTSDNQILFQDGAGVSHLMGPPAFGGIAFTVLPVDEVALIISAQDTWTKITVFNSPDGHVNAVDAGGNVTGNKTNSELTIGTDGGGAYRILLSSSISSVLASKMFFLGTAVDPASPVSITSHTSATPSVITTGTDHGLIVGDSVIISGSTDETINKHSMVKTVPSASTFTLDDFTGEPIGGTAGTGGTIDTVVHSSTIAHRVTDATNTGSFHAPGDIDVVAGDTVYAVILNRGDLVDVEFETINLQILRLGS